MMTSASTTRALRSNPLSGSWSYNSIGSNIYSTTRLPPPPARLAEAGGEAEELEPAEDDDKGDEDTAVTSEASVGTSHIIVVVPWHLAKLVPLKIAEILFLHSSTYGAGFDDHLDIAQAIPTNHNYRL